MISIILISVSIFLGIALSIYNIFVFQKGEYSILNCFPFESYKKENQRYILGVLVILYAVISSISAISVFNQVNFMNVISNQILYCISFLSLIGVFMFKFENYKSHLISTCLFLIGSFGANILTCATCIIAICNKIPFEINTIICFIIGAIGLFQVGFILFSKVDKWMKMDKVEENGKVIYVRPKTNPLALLEWFNLYIGIFVQVLFLISSILTYSMN